jgi:ubiquinone/menaquinone biosynthesis C-methylase UbiE
LHFKHILQIVQFNEVKVKIKRFITNIRSFITGTSLTIGTQNEETRLNWLQETLKKIPSGSRILDAGAGELAQKKYCTHLEYVSQDFAQYDGKGNNAGLQMQNWDNSKLDIVSDITDIPEPDASFNAIMCIEVFEHLPEPIAAIKEFSRLLKKNGTLILTAPFCSLTHFAPYHFYSGFNRYFYEKHLAENGFEIGEITPNGDYFEYLAQELRRIPEVAIKYSRYKNRKLNQSINVLLHLLQQMSDVGDSSSELLCFGYNIRAKKL